MTTVLVCTQWSSPSETIEEPDEQALWRELLVQRSEPGQALVLAGTSRLAGAGTGLGGRGRTTAPASPHERALSAQAPPFLDGGLEVVLEPLDPGWPQRSMLIERSASLVRQRGVLSAPEAKQLSCRAASLARELRHPPSQRFARRLAALQPRRVLVTKDAQSLVAGALDLLPKGCRIVLAGHGELAPWTLDEALAERAEEIAWFDPGDRIDPRGLPGLRRIPLPWRPQRPDRGLAQGFEGPFALVLADWPEDRALLWPQILGRALLNHLAHHRLVFVGRSSAVMWHEGRPWHATGRPTRPQLWGLMEAATVVADIRRDGGLGREAAEAAQVGTPFFAPSSHHMARHFALPYDAVRELVAAIATLCEEPDLADELGRRASQAAGAAAGEHDPSHLSRAGEGGCRTGS